MSTSPQRNIKLTVAYDGSYYHGWQRQIKSIITVQQVLEETLCRAMKHPVLIRGSGRTDTGVHALGQVANFRTTSPIPQHRLCHAINTYLPRTIRIHKAEVVDETFDAMCSARSKLYRYVVHNHANMDPRLIRYCHHLWHPCDEKPMQEASRFLVGEHDFAAFATTSHNRATTTRNLIRCDVTRDGDKIYFDLQANGFLYNMVRNIVGTLIEVGRGFWPISKVPQVLASKDRQEAGPKISPNGLTLQEVYY